MSFQNIYPSNCKSTFETATAFNREKWEKRNRKGKVPKVGACVCGRSSVVLIKGVAFTPGSVQLYISRRIHPDGMLNNECYSGCSTVRPASPFPPAFSSSDSSSNTSLNTKTSHQINNTSGSLSRICMGYLFQYLLVHVEKDVSAPVTISLNCGLLCAGDVQVIVCEPGLFLHVINITNIMPYRRKEKQRMMSLTVLSPQCKNNNAIRQGSVIS